MVGPQPDRLPCGNDIVSASRYVGVSAQGLRVFAGILEVIVGTGCMKCTLN